MKIMLIVVVSFTKMTLYHLKWLVIWSHEEVKSNQKKKHLYIFCFAQTAILPTRLNGMLYILCIPIHTDFKKYCPNLT